MAMIIAGYLLAVGRRRLGGALSPTTTSPSQEPLLSSALRSTNGFHNVSPLLETMPDVEPGVSSCRQITEGGMGIVCKQLP